MEAAEKTIDLRKAIKNSDSALFKSLPGFVIRLIEKIVRQDELNSTIYRSRHLQGIPFINDVLDGWKVEVKARGIENIPLTGRFIFVSNHPLGGMDALCFSVLREESIPGSFHHPIRYCKISRTFNALW